VTDFFMMHYQAFIQAWQCHQTKPESSPTVSTDIPLAIYEYHLLILHLH